MTRGRLQDRFAACSYALASVVLMAGICAADEASILADIAAFRRAVGRDDRLKLVRRIQEDASYQREKVSTWLHQSSDHEHFEPAVRLLRVPLESGARRGVRIRIPEGYDPARPWPLILAYHGSGGNAKDFVRYVSGLLGTRVDEFLIAAPHDYRQTVIDLPTGTTDEHPRVLRAIKREVHVDSDRVYALGYSLGGFTAWTLAILHSDQFAGAVPIAGAFSVPPEGNLWEAFFPNFEHVPILSVWGSEDRMPVRGFGGRRATTTMLELNRRLVALSDARDLNVENVELSGRGHHNVSPPHRALMELLDRRRVRFPRRVDHTVRQLYQAKAYWLEGQTWVGELWDAAFHKDALAKLNARPSEHSEATVAASVRQRLANLRGEVEDQAVSVQRTHIGELIVWLGDGMIDWKLPITLTVDGRKVFEGRVEPDLYTCLYHALRFQDFDRLVWAGLRVDVNGGVSIEKGSGAVPDDQSE